MRPDHHAKDTCRSGAPAATTAAVRAEAALLRRRRTIAGATMIELIISIVVIGVAIAGLAVLYERTSRSSADPMIEHQAIAIAESYLEEVLPLAYDELAASGAPEGALGPDAGETDRSDYDDVNDYHGLSDAGARSLAAPAVVITGLGNYTVTVTVVNDGNLGPGGLLVPAGNTERVDVRVTHTDGPDITISGYRTRY